MQTLKTETGEQKKINQKQVRESVKGCSPVGTGCLRWEGLMEKIAVLSLE